MEPQARDHSVARHRIDALADGVYAIAITLLVLELKIPALAHGATNADLVRALADVVPKALTWLLSFWVMAVFWLAQNRVAGLTARLDRGMVWLELTQLALISLMAFSTALIGEHGDLPAAAIVYSANLVAIALVSWVRVSHLIAHPELQVAGVEAATFAAMRRRTGMLVATTVATLVLAPFFPAWNMLAMLPAAFARRIARA